MTAYIFACISQSVGIQKQNGRVNNGNVGLTDYIWTDNKQIAKKQKNYHIIFCLVIKSIIYVLNLFQPTQVELVPGYGVYLTKRQLDEAMDQCCNTLPTT